MQLKNKLQFKVYKKQIPHDLIDKLLQQHDKFKKGKFSVFKAQGTLAFEYPNLNEFNNQKNSIHNPHILGFNPLFAKGIKDIIYHTNVSKCLQKFTGYDKFNHYQSMFFDVSTSTKLHQDTWYLDTKEKGNLVGVWIALEDIKKENGPFCLCLNSPNHEINPDSYNFDDLYMDKKFKSKFSASENFNFLAKKGDILIWRSFVIHGSKRPLDTRLTRKSITAHFYPEKFLIASPPITRFFSLYNHKKPVSTLNPDIKMTTTINPFAYNLMCLLLNLLGGTSKYLTNDYKANKKTSFIRKI
jgi:phytanoyl-CoA hydroxylase